MDKRAKNIEGKGVRFTSTKQPTGRAKSEGKMRAKFTRERIKELLAAQYNFSANSKVRVQLETAFGKQVIANADAGTLAIMQQINLAILKGDTMAAREILNQAFGMPKETVSQTTEIIKFGYDNSAE